MRTISAFATSDRFVSLVRRASRRRAAGDRHARPVRRDRPNDRPPLRHLRTNRRPRAALSSRQLRRQRSLLWNGRRCLETRRRDDRRRARCSDFRFDDLAHMPAGDYYAQALLNVYTQYHRADGHMVWVHADQWEGQHWSSSPGNLVSEVVKVHFDPAAHTTVKLALTKKLPPVDAARRHALGEAREDEERAAVQVLGRAGVHRRHGARAQGLRRVVDHALSRRLQPGPLRTRRAIRLRRPESTGRNGPRRRSADAAVSRACGIRRRRARARVV